MSGDQRKRIFTVGIDPSLKPSERQVIGSICKLSHFRLRVKRSGSSMSAAYDPILLNEENFADISIINIDQPSKERKKWLSLAVKGGSSIIILGNKLPKNIPLKFHLILKKKLGNLLLPKLDSIAEQEFRSKRRCLVVDDSELIRTQMSMILHDLNIKPFFAADGKGGILRAKGQNYDLIFLDVMLPDMDGYEVCKQLKKNVKTASIPITMLTSKGSPFNRMRGSMVGCDRYLVKPINAEQVAEAINDLSQASDLDD